MVLKHIALVCSSEENSDKFYEILLDLKKTGTKTVPVSFQNKFSIWIRNIKSSIMLTTKFILKFLLIIRKALMITELSMFVLESVILNIFSVSAGQWKLKSAKSPEKTAHFSHLSGIMTATYLNYTFKGHDLFIFVGATPCGCPA